MLLNRYYGSVLMEFPASVFPGLARAAFEQEVRDEVKPLWLVDILRRTLTHEERIGLDEFIAQIMHGDSDGDAPEEDALNELETIARHEREVLRGGFDLPAVR